MVATGFRESSDAGLGPGRGVAEWLGQRPWWLGGTSWVARAVAAGFRECHQPRPRSWPLCGSVAGADPDLEWLARPRGFIASAWTLGGRNRHLSRDSRWRKSPGSADGAGGGSLCTREGSRVEPEREARKKVARNP